MLTVDVGWIDDAKTILVWKFTGRWLWRDFEIAWRKRNELQDAVPYPVYHIFDLTDASLFPADFISRIRRDFSQPHQSTILRVVVGADRWLEIAWNGFVATGFPKLRANFADTMEEAIAFIEQHRAANLPSS